MMANILHLVLIYLLIASKTIALDGKSRYSRFRVFNLKTLDP